MTYLPGCEVQHCGLCRVSFSTADNQPHVSAHVWALHFGAGGYPPADHGRQLMPVKVTR